MKYENEEPRKIVIDRICKALAAQEKEYGHARISLRIFADENGELMKDFYESQIDTVYDLRDQKQVKILSSRKIEDGAGGISLSLDVDSTFTRDYCGSGLTLIITSRGVRTINNPRIIRQMRNVGRSKICSALKMLSVQTGFTSSTEIAELVGKISSKKIAEELRTWAKEVADSLSIDKEKILLTNSGDGYKLNCTIKFQNNS